MLGLCHQYGSGGPTNLVEAYKWFSIAADQDHELAKRTRSEIERLMTKEQIAEAQRLARELKPQQAP
jgi:TPR repeat protein